MDYCVKHGQYYTNYCVYCGKPPQKVGYGNSTDFCTECLKYIGGKCPQHSVFEIPKIEIKDNNSK